MKTLIAGISVRAMVESAVRSGYPVIALDAFGDQDLRLLTESLSLHHDLKFRYSPYALERASRTLSYDTIAYTSNLENHPNTLQRIAGSRQILGNAPEVVRAVRSWLDLFARLKSEGFAVPETYWAGERLKLDPLRRWLIKPRLSGGGHGVAFARFHDCLPDSYMLQEYIPGKSCSATFISNGSGCTVIGITEQLIGMRQFGSKGFRYCGNILPLPEILHPEMGSTILEQISQLAEFLSREYKLMGVNGIDFILKDEKVYLIEVNPRYSASMELIELHYEMPIYQMHIQAVLEKTLPGFGIAQVRNPTGFAGKAILFADRDSVMPDTKNWMKLPIRDIPMAGENIEAGNPVCTVMASQSTYEETLKELIRLAESLREQIGC